MCEDIRNTLPEFRDYDVVICASVGVLGRLDECMAELGQCVLPGGYMLIGNAFLADPP